MKKNEFLNLDDVFGFFRFWKKFEWAVIALRIIGIILVILTAGFVFIGIPIIDRNIAPIPGFIIGFLLALLALFIYFDLEKKLTGFIVGALAVSIFLGSYFVVFSAPSTYYSFVTKSDSLSLISYQRYTNFHLPIYHSHFSYSDIQEKELSSEDLKISVRFKFNFEELFKNPVHAASAITEKYFDKLIIEKGEKIFDQLKNYLNLNRSLSTELQERILEIEEPGLRVISLTLHFKSKGP